MKEAQLNEIALRCKNVLYKKGDVIFFRTDPSTDLYIVVSGRLKAVLEDEQGDEIVLAHFEKGKFFGELSLIDGKGRSATIIADEDSSLAILKRDLFFETLFKNPNISIELLITLVERLRNADEMIESLAFLEVSERLIKELAGVARESGEKEKGYLKFKKLTHRELAGRIGSSREAVSKCMKALAAKGIIKEADNYIFLRHDVLAS